VNGLVGTSRRLPQRSKNAYPDEPVREPKEGGKRKETCGGGGSGGWRERVLIRPEYFMGGRGEPGLAAELGMKLGGGA